MRNKVIAGNWKMYKSNPEARQFIQSLKNNLPPIKKTKIIVCPPATALSEVASILGDTPIGLGAQNIHWEKEGAFTGEMSAEMIKSTGAGYIIIGHSERRQYFGETNEDVNKKLRAALGAGLLPIVCVGESLEQREKGETFAVVGDQVETGLNNISATEIQNIIVAYEPIWAIGTGKTASPEQAQEVHKYLREKLADKFNTAVSEETIIQYGGSVKPENAHDLLSQPDIDGALVGGACLVAASFIAIIQAAEKIVNP